MSSKSSLRSRWAPCVALFCLQATAATASPYDPNDPICEGRKTGDSCNLDFDDDRIEGSAPKPELELLENRTYSECYTPETQSKLLDERPERRVEAFKDALLCMEPCRTRKDLEFLADCEGIASGSESQTCTEKAKRAARAQGRFEDWVSDGLGGCISASGLKRVSPEAPVLSEQVEDMLQEAVWDCPRDFKDVRAEALKQLKVLSDPRHKPAAGVADKEPSPACRAFVEMERARRRRTAVGDEGSN